MIQRMQSLFLLCTAIVTGLLFFMPMASMVVPDFTFDFYTTKVMQVATPPIFVAWNWMSFMLNVVITTLAMVTIFIRRKKSKTVKPTLFLQLRLCVVNIVLQLGLLVMMWLQVKQRAGDIGAEWHANVSFIFPLIGVILTWLAVRWIIKDIALLKSFDRIR